MGRAEISVHRLWLYAVVPCSELGCVKLHDRCSGSGAQPSPPRREALCEICQDSAGQRAIVAEGGMTQDAIYIRPCSHHQRAIWWWKWIPDAVARSAHVPEARLLLDGEEAKHINHFAGCHGQNVAQILQHVGTDLCPMFAHHAHEQQHHIALGFIVMLATQDEAARRRDRLVPGDRDAREAEINDFMASAVQRKGGAGAAAERTRGCLLVHRVGGDQIAVIELKAIVHAVQRVCNLRNV